MRVWLDTDIGSDVDDALALAYVVRHPGLELVGLSTVFGDLSVRTAIAERLLGLAGVDDVPVATGLGVPLTPRKRGVMFGHEGRGLLDDPDPQLRVAEEAGGATRIAELTAAIGDAAPDVLVAIGPLTNLAAMVQAGASLPPLAVMGGKLTDDMLPGMSSEIPEWNWFCDPTAVQVVLAAAHERPPIVVPAEITFQTQLAAGDIDALADGDQVAAALATLCEEWLELQRSSFGRSDPRVALHDPLTAAVLVASDLCTFEPRTVAVDDRGASTLGTADGRPVTAAVGVDPAAVRAHVMRWLLG